MHISEIYNEKFVEASEIVKTRLILHETQEQLFADEDYEMLDKAVGLLLECIELVPNAWACMWILGKVYQALDNPESSYAWLDRAVRTGEQNTDLYREASIAAMQTKRYEIALDYCEKANRMDSTDLGLWSNLALALFYNEREQEALNVINYVLENDFENPIAQGVKERILESVEA